MKTAKLTKVIITGLTGLSMGGALIAPSVLTHKVNAAKVTAVAKHQVKRNAKRHAKYHGLVTIKGKKYYYNVKGRRLKGWRTIRVHGRKYRVYLSKKNGAMLTGFRKIKAHRYYFSKKTGNMFRGTHKIGSKVYVFSKHGRLIKSYRAKKNVVKKNTAKKSTVKTNTFKVVKSNKKAANLTASKAAAPAKKAPVKKATNVTASKAQLPVEESAQPRRAAKANIPVGSLEYRIHENETNVDYALESADGKNIAFYGPDEPKDPREGDLWFKGDGTHAKQILTYQSGNWE